MNSKVRIKKDLSDSKKLDENQIVEEIIKQRDVYNIEEFLNPKSPLEFTLKDFGFKKKYIQKTMDLLSEIYKDKSSVVVYTDYDADGITGGAVLWEALHLLGFNVMPYVPSRKNEGYGFSKQGIDNVIKNFNPKLIISVDHGITGIEPISYAKSKGIDVIVTDHHHKQKNIPEDAFSIFHIPKLSGSGVAYFFAKEVFENFKDQSKNHKELENYFENDYQAISSIGTVADLVPLTEFSRSLVFHGLSKFKKIKRPGIVELLKSAEIEKKEITPYEIGYMIAPRINAVGRLENAIDALRLLCTKDQTRAEKLSKKLESLNKKRQEMVRKNSTEAENMIDEKNIPKVIILYSDHWNEGVIGLIASHILEEFYRPVIVMTKSEGIYKASARSISGFHMTEFLTELSDLLENFGGHAAAAGFSMKQENLDAFLQKSQKISEDLINNDTLTKEITADIKLDPSFLSKKLVSEINKMAPFGVGNPAPKFMSSVNILHTRILGKNKDHLKLQINSKKKNMFPLEMIAFGMGDIEKNLQIGQNIDLVYKININSWNGSESLQGIISYIDAVDL